MSKNQTEDFTKPGFDARMEYYKVVREYMVNIAKAQYESNISGWIRLLLGLFALVKGYLKPDDAKKIKEELRSVSIKLDNTKRSYSASNAVVMINVDRQLQNLTEDIYSAAKHMLLPIKDNEDDTFDEDAFTKGSDI